MESNAIDVTNVLGWSPEKVKERLQHALASNVLAYTLADAANSFFRDMEEKLKPLGNRVKREEKRKFSELAKAVAKCRYATEQATELLYTDKDKVLFCNDADFMYHLLMLLYDRLGESQQKTMQLVEYLDAMPSEGIFKIGIQDFLRE